MHTGFSGGADGPVRVATDTVSAVYALDSESLLGKESIVAFYNGQSMGLVTQWLNSSKNGKVVRRGCRVEAAKGLVTTTKDTYMLVSVPVHLKAQGVVLSTLTSGVADDPKSGDAEIQWSPSGKRSVVAVKDFDGLVVTSCGDEES
uniref:Uncharacterized protein n=1 Tax=Zooxanthella nutricula TaxID=1333877 RepID=A0A7S2M774_9DINO|mmetsp:Transcript_73506/g.224822  ORF Transcript_73506/g.224822 Transcript_73506/m.224822 type:complete len:146 (+) Transcript_73506:3-440(+)